MKKRVKSILTGLMVVSLLFTMMACSSKEVENTVEDTDATVEEAGTATEEADVPAEGAEDSGEEADSAAAYAPGVQEIIDRGVLRVGVKNDVIGFGYEDPLTSEYSGVEINIANKIAEELGVEVEFTPVTAATRTALLDAGDIDCVLATFTITDERKETWDFTTSYYTDYVAALVEDASGITTLEDLVDKTIGVSSGSTSARALVAAMIEKGILSGDGFDPETFDPATWTDSVTFQQFDDYPAISTALSASQIDAFCVDKSILAVYATEGRSFIEDQFAPQEYGIATKKDSDFSAYCEELVLGLLADGTIESYIQEFGL